MQPWCGSTRCASLSTKQDGEHPSRSVPACLTVKCHSRQSVCKANPDVSEQGTICPEEIHADSPDPALGTDTGARHGAQLHNACAPGWSNRICLYMKYLLSVLSPICLLFLPFCCPICLPGAPCFIHLILFMQFGQLMYTLELSMKSWLPKL